MTQGRRHYYQGYGIICVLWDSLQVDDLLRSGRVQFAGVPVAREASTLLNLHRTLVKHFEHLELNDRVCVVVVCCCCSAVIVVVD